MVPHQGALTRLLQQLRVPAEHSTGKRSWVPPGRCQGSPSHQEQPLQVPAMLGSKRRSLPARWPGSRKGSRAAPALSLPRELRVPCTLLTGQQTPKSSSTMKIKIKPKPVLLEQSWSQVLDKAQEFSEQGDAGGASPIPLACTSCRKTLRNHPLLQLHHWEPWAHLPSPSQPFPALQSQLQQQQAGLRGRGRGNGSPGCCGAPWINSALFPGRDYNREMPSLISRGIRSSVLGVGSCMDQPAPGSNPAAPAQYQRGITILPAPSQAEEFW